MGPPAHLSIVCVSVIEVKSVKAEKRGGPPIYLSMGTYCLNVTAASSRGGTNHPSVISLYVRVL